MPTIFKKSSPLPDVDREATEISSNSDRRELRRQLRDGGRRADSGSLRRSVGHERLERARAELQAFEAVLVAIFCQGIGAA